jgi:WD40 repeat protein
LSASTDGTVKQWDLRTGKAKGTLPGLVGPIAQLAFAAKLIAVVGQEGVAIRKRHAPGFEKLTGHEGAVVCVAVSPDGALLASGGTDRTVRVYRADTGAQLACYAGHDKGVRSVAFAPTGDAVYSGGEDGTLRRWLVPKGK